MCCSVSFLASDRIPSHVQQTGKRTPGIFFGLRNQTKKHMLKNSPSSNFSHPMQLAANLRQVPKDPSGITDPEVWAHVNRTLPSSLLLVPGTNWPEKHHSPPGADPLMGPCTSPKTDMLPGIVWLPATLGLNSFCSPGDQKPHFESPNPKFCLGENIMEFG